MITHQSHPKEEHKCSFLAVIDCHDGKTHWFLHTWRSQGGCQLDELEQAIPKYIAVLTQLGEELMVS